MQGADLVLTIFLLVIAVGFGLYGYGEFKKSRGGSGGNSWPFKPRP
jgi:hypothetical protein